MRLIVIVKIKRIIDKILHDRHLREETFFAETEKIVDSCTLTIVFVVDFEIFIAYVFEGMHQ